jgi:hypothetical protein
MKQLGRVSQIADVRNAHTMLAEKCKAKKLLGRYEGRPENRIQMDKWEVRPM